MSTYFAVAKGHLAEVATPVTIDTEPFVLPEDHIFTLHDMEHETRQLDPHVKGDNQFGVSLFVTDEKGDTLILYDLAEAIDHSEETLADLRSEIYERTSDGEQTQLIYNVYGSAPHKYRTAIVATPIWYGDVAKGHLTWNIRSLLANGEEIARLCRLLNKHGLYMF